MRGVVFGAGVAGAFLAVVRSFLHTLSIAVMIAVVGIGVVLEVSLAHTVLSGSTVCSVLPRPAPERRPLQVATA